MDSLRFWCLLLIFAGAVAGATSPISSLIAITITIVLLVAIVLFSNRSLSYTSGGLGLRIILYGAMVCILVPMWITRLLR